MSSAAPLSRLAFHHLGLLTGRPELAARRLEALGYEMGEEVFDPLQEARLRLGSPGSGSGPTLGPAVELITPLPGNISLARLLKRRDDYIYHLCYEVSDLKEALAILAADEGVLPVEISRPKPAVLFGGAEVSFYLTAGLGLVELVDLESRTKD